MPLDYIANSNLIREQMMKYLCLLYEDESAWNAMTPKEVEGVMAAYNTFTEDIIKSGNMVSGEALQPTQTASTVRVRNGKMQTTDGPFAETKEQLGGFYLIEAKDLNEALQIASRIPAASTGSVEVRPIMVFE